MRYKKIERCRVSGDKNLISVLHLGDQALTGIFPARQTENMTIAPLELVWSPSQWSFTIKSFLWLQW